MSAESSIGIRSFSGATGPAVARGFGLAPLVALFHLSLRQHLHGKRPLVMLLFLLLPACIALVFRSTLLNSSGGVLEFSFVFMLIPQALLPLIAMVYVLGVVQDEQEGQTITYLLVRPIPKWGLYFVKLLATTMMAVVLTAALTVLVYAAIYLGSHAQHDIPLRCLKAVAIHSLTVTAYCCLFGLISLLTRWTLVTCVVYTAVIEWLFANLPFSIRLITVIYYARLIAYRSMSFIVDAGGRHFDIAADPWQLSARTDPGLLEHPQLSTCLIVLLVGSLVCALLGAFVCSQKEFYVKTPEQL